MELTPLPSQHQSTIIYSSINNNLITPKQKAKMGLLLPELPTEIVEHICSHLDEYELRKFRLTSRAMNQKSFNYCSTELFHTLPTCMSQRSLERRQEMLRNVELAQGVRTLLWKDYGQDFGWDEKKPSPLHPCLQALAQVLHVTKDCTGLSFRSIPARVLPDYVKEEHQPPYHLALIWMVLASHEFDSLALELTSRFCYKHINASWHQQEGTPKPEVAAAWAKSKGLTISHDADPRLRKNTK